MKIESNLIKSNKNRSDDYNLNEVCRILNPKQQMLYIKHGLYPIEMYTSIDSKTDNDVLVMIFLRDETTEAYIKWCNHELT